MMHACFFQSLDGEFYEKARQVYMLYAQIESDAANFVRAEFDDLREQSYLVSIVCSMIKQECTRVAFL